MEIAGKEGYRHILASSVVFEFLPPAALDHISTRGLLVEMESGEPVLAEGTRGPALYVLLEGLVEIFLPDGAGARSRRPPALHFSPPAPGRCLWESILIHAHPTS